LHLVASTIVPDASRVLASGSLRIRNGFDEFACWLRSVLSAQGSGVSALGKVGASVKDSPFAVTERTLTVAS
jgi:hypothetical protein